MLNFFRQTREVAAKSCGVSLACVKKICSETKKELEVGCSNKFALKSPMKNYKRVKVMTNLDDFDNEVIRRTIHNFYDNGELRRNNDTRPVVYLDETWVNQNHTQGYI